MNVAASRLVAAGLLGCSLLAPSIASAAPAGTGTLVGSVTCGQGAQEVGRAEVSVQGLDLSTRTTDGGKFSLVGVPAAGVFTIDAIGDSTAAPEGSRFDVSVSAGETLDIGAIDLGVCVQPTTEQVTTPEVTQEEISRDEP